MENKVKESKNQKFKRIATERTNKILRDISRLKNCAARSGYAYSPEEVEQIFTVLNEEIASCRAAFQEKPKQKLKTFTFLESEQESDPTEPTDE